MFYGHIGVALAAKPLAPRVSVGVLLVAAVAMDVLCGVFIALGIEHVDIATGISSIPWSHGLFMSVIWSLITFILAFVITRDVKTEPEL